MFYIHGNILLNGAWSVDLRCAVETMLMTDGVRKILGRDAITGDSSSPTYIIMGHGGLVLFDLFNAFDFLFDRYRDKHPRTCENLLKAMQDDNLSVEFRTSQHDMNIFDADNHYSTDGLIVSDGIRPVLKFSVGKNQIDDSLDGYGLTRLAELAMKPAFDIDFSELDTHTQSAIRCLLYFNITGQDFFDALLHIMREPDPDKPHFYIRMDDYIGRYIDANWKKICKTLDEIAIKKI